MFLRCYYHREYDGSIKPKNCCLDCWEYFMELNQNENLKTIDILRVIRGLREQLLKKMNDG